MKRKRFIKLLMGRLGLTRNEANYVADVTRVTDEREKRRRNGRKVGKQFAWCCKTGGQNDADQH